MKKEIKNIEGSVRARLDNKRKELNIPFLEILRTYAMERFLYRLSKTDFAKDFVLKGALLFTVWDVRDQKIVKWDIHQPWKLCYEKGLECKRPKKHPRELQRMASGSMSSIWRPTAGRWSQYRRMMQELIEAVVGQ